MYRFLTANENTSYVCQAHAPAIKTLPDSESSIKTFVQIMRIAAERYKKMKRSTISRRCRKKKSTMEYTNVTNQNREKLH